MQKEKLGWLKLNFSFSATFSHDFLKEIYGNPRSRKPKLHFPRDQLFAASKDISLNSSINVEESVIDWTTGAHVMKLVHKL